MDNAAVVGQKQEETDTGMGIVSVWERREAQGTGTHAESAVASN